MHARALKTLGKYRTFHLEEVRAELPENWERLVATLYKRTGGALFRSVEHFILVLSCSDRQSFRLQLGTLENGYSRGLDLLRLCATGVGA